MPDAPTSMGVPVALLAKSETPEERSEILDATVESISEGIIPVDMEDPNLQAVLGHPDLDEAMIDQSASWIADGGDYGGHADLAAAICQTDRVGEFSASLEKHLGNAARFESQVMDLRRSFHDSMMPLLEGSGRNLPESTFVAIASFAPSDSMTDQKLAHAWTERTRPDDQLEMTFPK